MDDRSASGQPSRGDRGATSSIGGVLNVVRDVYQIVNGATDWLFYAVLVASGQAGALSFAARNSRRATGARGGVSEIAGSGEKGQPEGHVGTFGPVCG